MYKINFAMYWFIRGYILTNVEFQLKTKSILMTTDDILRGTSKDIIVFGAIVGFNRLEVNDSDFQGKEILNNLHTKVSTQRCLFY